MRYLSDFAPSSTEGSTVKLHERKSNWSNGFVLLLEREGYWGELGLEWGGERWGLGWMWRGLFCSVDLAGSQLHYGALFVGGYITRHS